jgi:NhaP-type Na+/H+ or K+/H+ antiporter
MILFITFTVIMVTLVLQGLTLPALVRLLKMPDPDFTVSFEQQKQHVRKKLSLLALQLLEDKYSSHLANNDMVKALKLRLTADMELLKDWEKEDSEHRADDFYHDYKMIMNDVMGKQRALLLTLNKKENINDDIVRQQLDLLDLEEEKLRMYFEVG